MIHALKLIHADESEGGDYNEGMDILCGLAGLPTPYSKIMASVRSVSIEEVAARPNSEFIVMTQP